MARRKRTTDHSLSNGRSVACFKAWLMKAGLDVQTATNDYELVRFRSADGLSLIYQNNKGRPHKMTGRASDAWAAFVNDDVCPLKAAPPAWIGKPDTRPIRMSQADLLDRAAAESLTIAFVMEINAMPMREAAGILFEMEREGSLVRSGGEPGRAFRWAPVSLSQNTERDAA